MSKLLTAALFLVATTGWCQQVIGTAEPKYGPGENEVFFLGDTALVRFIFDKMATARVGSVSGETVVS